MLIDVARIVRTLESYSKNNEQLSLNYLMDDSERIRYKARYQAQVDVLEMIHSEMARQEENK